MDKICVVGASGNTDVEVLKNQLQTMGILGVDAEMVCGKDHLLAAALCAKKAFDSGKNICSTLQMEIMLYASGERQIAKATSKMSIKDSHRVALVIFDNSSEEVFRDLKMQQNDEVLIPSKEKMKNYGISDEEMKSVPEESIYDLILEHVAFAVLRNK